MAVEDLLKQLITSLDANTAALKGAKGTTVAATGTTTAKADTKPAIEFDVVKLAAGKVVKAKDKAFAKNLIETVGKAKELASVKPAQYAALLAAFEGALSEPADEPEPAEDDDL